MHIAITADQGIVTLAGIVDRSSEPVHASEVIAALPRVKEIRNQLNIASASRVKLDS
jgi:osmotically-inducible protein OsmY